MKKEICIAGNVYYALLNYILEMYDDDEEIYCLYDKYFFSDDKEKKVDILKKD